MEETIQTQVPATVQYASFGRRFLAYFVDLIILQLLSLLLSVPLGIISGVSSALSSSTRVNNIVAGMTNITSMGISLLLGIAYFTFFLSKQNGQTLGKKLLAIRVVKENGEKIDLATAIIRYIGYIISALPLFLGFLWMLWDGKKQTLHDKIAKTVVVKTDKKPKTGVAIALVGCCLIIPIILAIVGIIAGAALMVVNPAEKMNLVQDQNLQAKAQNLYSALSSYNNSYPTQQIKLVNGACPSIGESGLCPEGKYVQDISIVGDSGFLIDSTNEELSQLTIRTSGSNLFVCFVPKSKEFQKNAVDSVICTSGGID